MDGPPAQDSPRHILNSLNDHCIQEIIRRLNRLEDFLSVAETCTRFQKNAQNCFKLKFKRIIIGGNVNTVRNLPTPRVQSCLSIFGHLIEQLFWIATKNPAIDKESFKSIGQFCGKTLNHITIGNYNVMLQKRLRFTALQSMSLHEASVRNCEFHSQLRTLIMHHQGSIPIQLRIREFPNLQHLSLRGIKSLTNARLSKFLSLNQLLTKLEIDKCAQLTPPIFKDVGKYLPDLEHFKFIDPLRVVWEDELVPLCGLRKLRRLQLTTLSIGCIHILAENDVPIENLSFYWPSFENLLKNMPKLPKLKRLQVQLLVTPDSLIRLLQAQPTVEELIVPHFEHITMHIIETAFIYGINLKKLLFCTYKLDVALNNATVSLAGGRIVLGVSVTSSKVFDFPEGKRTFAAFTFTLRSKNL